MALEKTMVLQISGAQYIVNKDIFLKKPDSYLGRLAVNGSSKISFDRPLSSFDAILAFYQTGELHMPTNVCPKAFKTELKFWGISHLELQECCLYKYLQFIEDINLKTNFMKQTTDVETRDEPKRKIRTRIWRVIDNREPTLAAKVYLLIGIISVLISTIMLAVLTLPQNRRCLTPCEVQEYFRDQFEDFIKEKTSFLSVNCKDIILHDEYFTIGTSNTTYDLPDKMPTLTVKENKLMIVEYLTLVFFTVELLFRLVCCPDLKGYFMSFINIADIVSLIAGYSAVNLWYFTKRHQLVPLKDVLDHLQVLRSLRLVRYCQHFSTVQVLKFSLVQNIRDIFVLLLYLVIGIFMFANIIYLVESKRNDKLKTVPEAWWLGIVTMTTVGYGDITPNTATGKIVCGLCALSGVMLISIILPIFVDSFITLYGIAKLKVKNQRQRENYIFNNITPVEKI